jgi:hypothetical protein
MGQALMAAIAFAALHTRTGRRLLLVGWLTLTGIIVLNLWLVEVNWETARTLLVVLGVGALWFVDWTRVLRGVREYRPLPPQMGGLVLSNKKDAPYRR